MKKVLLIIISVASYFAATASSDTASVSLVVGTSKFANIAIVDDTTGALINATITNVAVQNNTPGIASITASTTQVTASPVAIGNGTATITCHVNYTDAGDGQLKSEDKTVVIAYTVIGSPHGVKLSLSF